MVPVMHDALLLPNHVENQGLMSVLLDYTGSRTQREYRKEFVILK